MFKFIFSIVALFFLSLSVYAVETKAGSTAGIGQGSVAKSALNVSNYTQMILGLLVVVAMIFAIAWLLRKMGRFQNTAGTGMKLLGGISLGQRERALLIQVGETQLLLGVAPGRVQTLHVFDKPVIQESDSNSSGGFVDKLNSVLKQKAGM